MPEKTEKEEFHSKWENLYVFTGRKSDLTTMLSIAVINPFIGYVAGKQVSLPALFLIMDGALLLQWAVLVKRRKRKMQMSIQDEAGRMDNIRRKIDELEK